MKFEALNNLLDDINVLCKEVETETEDLCRKKKEEDEARYKKMAGEFRGMLSLMEKAGLYEFAYPTSFKGSAYGTTEWLVLVRQRFVFAESGRVRRWTSGHTGFCNPGGYADWWDAVDKADFEKKFTEAIYKATQKKIDDVIKRNEEAKLCI